MTRSIVGLLALLISSTVLAHHPDRRNTPVRPRVDVIGPVGNRLPAEYRRTYNRPTYIGGKIAYLIAPSSQESMVWHRSEHMGLYNGKHHGKYCPPVQPQYFYPKPWEALRVGARPDRNAAAKKTLAARQGSNPEAEAEILRGELAPEMELPTPTPPSPITDNALPAPAADAPTLPSDPPETTSADIDAASQILSPSDQLITPATSEAKTLTPPTNGSDQ